MESTLSIQEIIQAIQVMDQVLKNNGWQRKTLELETVYNDILIEMNIHSQD
jgi:hypothetical protein